MRRSIELLACSLLLAVTAAAQTSPAPAGEEVLQINRFSWGEKEQVWCGDDCGHQLPVTQRWRSEHGPGRGVYRAKVVIKNEARKPIKAIDVDFVFRDTATEREFLTYHLRAERRIGPGQKKELLHKIGGG